MKTLYMKRGIIASSDCDVAKRSSFRISVVNVPEASVAASRNSASLEIDRLLSTQVVGARLLMRSALQ